MEIETTAYLAGLIDGEGCIGLGCRQGRYITPTLQITNTHRGIIDWLLRDIGGTSYDKREPRPGRKQCFLWRTAGKEARDIIRLIYPHLRIKREQAAVVLAVYDNRDDLVKQIGKDGLLRDQLTHRQIQRNQAAVAEIRALNQRGVPV